MAQSAQGSWQAVKTRVNNGFHQSWQNPLFHHARRLKPLPKASFRIAVPAALVLAVISLAAWIASTSAFGRITGAIFVVLSFAFAFLPALLSAPFAANWTSQQLNSDQDPRKLKDLPSAEITWGVTLAALWRLRWLLLLCLIFTPALMLGLFRLDLSAFQAWQQSAQSLGGATAASRSVYLLSDGSIPYFRLAVRALSLGFLTWSALPLLASFGVFTVLRLLDPLVSMLTALTGGAAVAYLSALMWHFISLTPLISGVFEVLRLVLLAGYLVGLLLLAVRLNRLNAKRFELLQ